MSANTQIDIDIAIIGGGLSGLTLARVLHLNGIRAAVFEQEDSFGGRGQDGMLDIHEDSGQEALRVAGLHDAFRALVHNGGQAMRLVAPDGRVLLAEPDDADGGRPEVNRGDLRHLLLESIPPESVSWGRKLATAEPLTGGRHELTFDDDERLTCGALVGADGAWSRIRPLVSAATPTYTGISFVELRLEQAERRHPEAAALIGSGFFIALGEHRGYLAHKETDGSLHVYCALETPESWLANIDFGDRDAAKRRLLAEFAGWAAPFQDLVTKADGALVPRPIHALPVGHRWQRTPGVTLLGDAAHLMSPFAGEGANLAMLDGAELGRAIADHPADIEAALEAYETRLFPRSESAARESAESLALMFGDGGLEALLARFIALQREGTPAADNA